MDHNISDFLKRCRNESKAFDKISDAFTKAAAGKGDGLVEITVDVGGFPITMTGNIIGGIAKLATAYIK